MCTHRTTVVPVRLAAHRMVWSNWIMKESNVIQYKYVSHAIAPLRGATLHGTMCVCNTQRNGSRSTSLHTGFVIYNI